MMKKFILCIFCLIFIFNLIFAGDDNIPAKNTVVYLKWESAWFISNDNDLEKNVRDIKEKKVFYFGNKVTVVGNKKIKDKIYLNVMLPDKSKYWAPMDYFTQKFITITENDLRCYTQPDEDYLAKYKLQAGYFGYYNTEQNGWIKVQFISYVPGDNPEDKPFWIGDVWIKSGYTDDIKTAKQGYLLALAYNALYGKNKDVELAIKKLEGAISNSEGETSITYVLTDLLNQLKEGVKINTIEMVENNYYTPNVKNLRFRETPTVDGKVIRSLNQGEKLKLVEKGQEETINGVKGIWGKFETENGEVGWCFNAYLSEVK